MGVTIEEGEWKLVGYVGEGFYIVRIYKGDEEIYKFKLSPEDLWLLVSDFIEDVMRGD